MIADLMWLHLKVNYYGTKLCCQLLFPLLREGSRVVNVSSSTGFLANFGDDRSDESKALKAKFASSDSSLEVAELDALMEEFLKAKKDKIHLQKGWPNSSYTVSKVGVSALTRILSRESAKKNVLINHVHPGFVGTDLTNHRGSWTPEQGAVSVLHCALLPSRSTMTGQYVWHDCSQVDWVNGPIPF